MINHHALTALLKHKNGDLFWQMPVGNRKAGDRAGDRFTVTINKITYPKASISYYLATGEYPRALVALDGNIQNIDPDNLKKVPAPKNYNGPAVTPLNPQNPVNTTTSTDHKYVYRVKTKDLDNNRFKVVYKNSKYLGTFDTQEEALAALKDYIARPFTYHQRKPKPKGIHLDKSSHKWHAQLVRNKVRYFLGQFLTENQALKKRQWAENAADWELTPYEVKPRLPRYCQAPPPDHNNPENRCPCIYVHPDTKEYRCGRYRGLFTHSQQHAQNHNIRIECLKCCKNPYYLGDEKQ